MPDPTVKPHCTGLRTQPHSFDRYAQDHPPEALLITCTDPILDATLLAQFRSAPVLVWRNVGPIIPPYGVGQRDVDGAIDQAVAEWGVSEIAICGHLPGGALQALLGEDTAAKQSGDDPWLHYALATRRVVQEKYGPLKAEELLRAIVEENVFVQMANLRTYPAILAGLAKGRLKVHGLIYDAHEDELFAHGPSPSSFLKRVKGIHRPVRSPLPHIDPCDIYLA
jgi:carbonic anhydrase